MNRLISASATGVIDAQPGELSSVGLTAGADAATLTVRDGGASGTVLLKLAAPAGESASRLLRGSAHYQSLYATLTGTSPVADFEV